jgi:lactate dehydrogenase-like 2-hydroxyacid dehydrogenase
VYRCFDEIEEKARRIGPRPVAVLFPDDPIFQYNVMATPHIAGSTDVSMRGIVRTVAENIRRVASGRLPLHLKSD